MRWQIYLLVTCLGCFPLAGRSAESNGPAVGSMAPDFTAHNAVTGEIVPLSSQHGKVVILTFWASWCGPCRRELPVLENAQRIVGKDKVTVFAVSYRETHGATASLKKQEATWRLTLVDDPDGWIASHYSISRIPHLFIIGRDGRVVANHLGYGDHTLNQIVADLNHALHGNH